MIKHTHISIDDSLSVEKKVYMTLKTFRDIPIGQAFCGKVGEKTMHFIKTSKNTAMSIQHGARFTCKGMCQGLDRPVTLAPYGQCELELARFKIERPKRVVGTFTVDKLEDL